MLLDVDCAADKAKLLGQVDVFLKSIEIRHEGGVSIIVFVGEQPSLEPF